MTIPANTCIRNGVSISREYIYILCGRQMNVNVRTWCLQDNALVGDEFMRQIEAVAAYVPYMVGPGNHESH